MDGSSYLDGLRREFARLRSLSERALAQVDDAGFFAAEGQDNALAVTVKHLGGNLRSRWRDFLTTDGEKPDRHRDSEFVISESRGDLMDLWNAGFGELESTLSALGSDDLERRIQIRGEDHSVLEAAQRSLSHVAYHVGQIVASSRHSAGESWTSLSIPKGGSVTFNAKPDRYLER